MFVRVWLPNIPDSKTVQPPEKSVMNLCFTDVRSFFELALDSTSLSASASTSFIESAETVCIYSYHDNLNIKEIINRANLKGQE